MDNDVYNGCLRRLTEYRKKHNVSQKKMGELLGVTQSHYSKIEQGQKLVSYTSLFRMQEQKVDIDYILTGVHYKESILNEYIQRCEKEQQANMLAHIIWVMRQGISIQQLRITQKEKVDYRKIVSFLQMRTDSMVNEDKDTVWLSVRKLDGKTQEQMAENLHVGIKKYRQIEKGTTQPDAQVLSELYDKLGYFPSIMMPELTVNLSYLNDIWERFDKDLQKDLLSCIESGFELIRMASGKQIRHIRKEDETEGHT